MEKHLPRIHTRWRRLTVSLYLSFLIFIGRFYRRRSNIHWIGAHQRARRLERPMIVLLFAAAMLLLEPREYVMWSIIMGPAISLYLIVLTVYRLLPRRRAVKERRWRY